MAGQTGGAQASRPMLTPDLVAPAVTSTPDDSEVRPGRSGRPDGREEASR
jgi:hypothetical protein